MALFRFLHHHQTHRSRQMRWVLPIAGCVLVAVLAIGAIVYEAGDREVEREFFRAHKTVSQTGELLWDAVIVGVVSAVALVGGCALYGLHLTHRIVRPLHTIHRALDALADGDLGVRVELRRDDEFREIGDAMNRLASRLRETVEGLETVAQELEVACGTSASDDEAGITALRRLTAGLRDELRRFHLEPERCIREDVG